MKYISYELYKCSSEPTETGEYVGKTPVLKQAIEAVEKSGNRLFIKGITKDSERVVFV